MGRGSRRWAGNGAELAHVLHHALHIFDRGTGNNAVPQIEDMPGPAAGLREYLMHAFSEKIFTDKKREGVEVALTRTRMAEGGPALVQGHPPIETDHVG